MESRTDTMEAHPDPEKLYTQAIAEHLEYLTFSQTEIKDLISNTVEEIAHLERIGEKDKAQIESPVAVLKNIAVVWIISGPGTYDLPSKDDKYNNFPWARGMDRARLNHGAMLARRIAESRSGQKFDGPLGDVALRKRMMKETIENYGPEMVYNGTQLENDTVLDVLSREGTVIPEGKVHIIRGNIKTTLDQVKTFKLPVELNENEELAIISHAPHLVRIMNMINKNPPFPTRTKVRLFPVPTLVSGRTKYAEMETLGLLRYVYLDNESTVKRYPYLVSSDTG